MDICALIDAMITLLLMPAHAGSSEGGISAVQIAFPTVKLDTSHSPCDVPTSALLVGSLVLHVVPGSTSPSLFYNSQLLCPLLLPARCAERTPIYPI